MKKLGNLVLGITVISAISIGFSGCGGTIAQIGHNKYSVSGEVEDADDRSDLHDDVASYCGGKGLYSALIRERTTSTSSDGDRYMVIDFKCITEAEYKRGSIPKHIKRALKKKGMMKKYLERPISQQKDYIGWIDEAGKEKEQEKRINQMLDELKVGGVSTKAKHTPIAPIQAPTHSSPSPKAP